MAETLDTIAVTDAGGCPVSVRPEGGPADGGGGIR
jgi:hypothetical protein